MVDYDTNWVGGIVPRPPVNISPPKPPTQPLSPSPVPQPPIQEAEIVTKEEPAKEEEIVHKYRAVRGGGDQIFLLIGNKKHWVLNADVYAKLGYRFGDEEAVEPAIMATYIPGETITPENYQRYK